MVAFSSIDKEKIAVKLHKQFAHPTSETLIKVIRNAEIKDDRMERCITSITEKCETCIKNKRPKPRPVVCVPMATEFNECIAFDLKVWGNSYFLVVVDLATRFCAATVIRNKLTSTIIKGLFLSWITIFGPPKKLISDNGGEFNSGDMRELGEAFNVKVMTTAAESPWSNGVVERLNGVIGNLVSKIIDDTKCDVDIALAWAVSARNALTNKSGFSPNQLVFGFNPAVPDVFHSSPPALEPLTSSTIVRRILNGQHASRQEFLKYDSNESLRRALRHNIRTTDVEELYNGDEVYYKRNNSSQWCGPGIVIGRDGKLVLIRHGGIYVRVHSCRLTKAPIKFESCENTIQENEMQINNRCPPTDEDDDTVIVSSDTQDDIPLDTANEEGGSDENDTHMGPLDDLIVGEEGNIEGNVTTNDRSLTASGCDLRGKSKSVSIGQRIKGLQSSTGDMISGKIVSRAGKATGKYKDCYNIKYDSDGKVGWIDLNDLSEWSDVPNDVEMVIMFNSEEVLSAKNTEMLNWIDNCVYEEVEDEGQDFITVRWVITEKLKNDKTLIRARLVARGFEEDTLNLRKDSSTCSKESVRLAIAIAASNRWNCHTLDVKAAYLQGNAIDRDVYLKPPPEYFNGTLWKLKKTVYGLCDAARAWYLRVKEELLAMSAQMCSLDQSLFSWYNCGVLEGIICVHVDDFLWAGTLAFEEAIINKLSDMFTIGSSASSSFKYVGLNIESNNEGITMDQFQYASSLTPINISNQRRVLKSGELSSSEKSEYRSLIGQLNWMATQTRPDIAFETCVLSVSYNGATVSDLLRINKLVSCVTKDHMKLFFPKLQCLDLCVLECYTDASFANLPGDGSQGAFIIFLVDKSGARCPIFWQTRKIRRVVKSTLSAEALALLEGAEAAVYIDRIFQELTHCPKLKINCIVDNKSLVDSLYSSKNVEDRRLRIDIAVLRDMLDRKEISSVSWVDTSKQLADCLTKRGASTMRLRAAISRD